ncbi:hypothetical protein MPTK1_5g10640 [Marchantia polymorpha subsp. ruderalis]|uniref:Uncharacterized protein n=2 Tax=Marchantia polymorpha TaxID=3197 RepID=A0AAF6BH07_MARPO|nr:hypothetical protein MARPO_0048s0008 [Marchantia polymorpha]BBN11291.1 hypothetical protein Mp_5g10640 [Marchantia polymorpha subsp. ruderalis]|eukprot:PTQ38880.1 hypothetical protein MARPO_0048s0008 [Marchantia polymorpha]
MMDRDRAARTGGRAGILGDRFGRARRKAAAKARYVSQKERGCDKRSNEKACRDISRRGKWGRREPRAAIGSLELEHPLNLSRPIDGRGPEMRAQIDGSTSPSRRMVRCRLARQKHIQTPRPTYLPTNLGAAAALGSRALNSPGIMSALMTSA